MVFSACSASISGSCSPPVFSIGTWICALPVCAESSVLVMGITTSMLPSLSASDGLTLMSTSPIAMSFGLTPVSSNALATAAGMISSAIWFAISCALSFVTFVPLSASSTAFFNASCTAALTVSTLSAGVVGNFVIVLSIAVSADSVPLVIVTFPVTLPAAFVVASVLAKSSTVMLIPLPSIPASSSAAFTASLIAVCMLSFVVALDTVMSSSAFSTASFAAATFSASENCGESSAM